MVGKFILKTIKLWNRSRERIFYVTCNCNVSGRFTLTFRFYLAWFLGDSSWLSCGSWMEDDCLHSVPMADWLCCLNVAVMTLVLSYLTCIFVFFSYLLKHGYSYCNNKTLSDGTLTIIHKTIWQLTSINQVALWSVSFVHIYSKRTFLDLIWDRQHIDVDVNVCVMNKYLDE